MSRRRAKWDQFGPKVVVIVDNKCRSYQVHIVENVKGVIPQSTEGIAIRDYNLCTGEVALYLNITRCGKSWWSGYRVVRTGYLPCTDHDVEQHISIFPCKKGIAARMMQRILARFNEAQYVCTNCDPEDIVQTLVSVGCASGTAGATGIVDHDGCPREVCTD